MNKIEYKKLLNNKKWLEKRIEILKRDKFTCTKCQKFECQLHIHHTIYIQNKKPWEYNNKYLITLCIECHNKIHKDKKIKTYKYDPNFKKEKGPSYKLSKRDQELQNRYDKIRN